MKPEWKIEFDHAAIATSDPVKLKQVFLLLGLQDAGNEVVESQGVNTHFLKPASGKSQIELLEVIDPKGVVARYLEKKGSGIHHLSFKVSDLKKVCQKLRENKIRLTYDEPKDGAHHTLVNFIHPESTGGILIELSQNKIAG